MAESKHTPGPWECGRAPEEPDTILIGAEATLFCRIVGTPGSPAEPNARLITAAPDLLAACKAAEQFLQMIGNPAPPHPWRQLVDAIAKAEGK